jgi:hypothetical protein
MSRRLLGVAAAGLAIAVAAESVTYLPEAPELAAADATVGLSFIGLGVLAWQRRPSSWSGLLMAATGVAWFAGSFVDAALFLHRGSEAARHGTQATLAGRSRATRVAIPAHWPPASGLTKILWVFRPGC